MNMLKKWRYQVWIVICPIEFFSFQKGLHLMKNWWIVFYKQFSWVETHLTTVFKEHDWRDVEFQPEFCMMMTSSFMTDWCILLPSTASWISSACWVRAYPWPSGDANLVHFSFFHSLASSPQEVNESIWRNELSAWFIRKCWVNRHWCLLDREYMRRLLSDDIDLLHHQQTLYR